MNPKETQYYITKELAKKELFSSYNINSDILLVNDSQNLFREVAVLMTDYKTALDLEFKIFIRHSDISTQIAEIIGGALAPETFALSPTHAAFAEKRDPWYAIPDDWTPEQVIEDFYRIFEEKIQPFIQKCQDLMFFEKQVNQEVGNHAFFKSNLDSKAILGIYLRSKTDPSTLPKLIDDYRKAISVMSDWQREPFEKMVEHLGSNS